MRRQATIENESNCLKDVYSLTYAPIFTKIIIRSKMRNDPHIFPTATCCENVTQASRMFKSDV